ncbi:glycosyltransferase [archaeon]|nr:glycosyltransferase [archaeon]
MIEKVLPEVDASFRGEHPEMKASIIIPAYNNEKTIQECLRACKQQTVKPLEIIVIDDGSTDRTTELAKSENVIVFSQKNSGPAKARNLGAEKSKGDILIFTDSDCVPEKNWLQEMLSPFKDKEVVGVQGAYKSKQKSIIAKFNQLEIEERYERMKKSKEIDWIGSYSAGYRKKDFQEANGFDESFPKASGEDPELSYKLAKQGKKLAFNPKAIVYHYHPETLFKYLKVKFERAFYRVNLYSKHTDKIVKDSYTTPWIKFQIAAGYAGFVLFLVSIPLISAGQFALGAGALGLSTIIGTLGLLSTLQFTKYALKKDFGVAVASLIIIPLRTIAFQLGLVLGTIKYKVLK